MSKNSLDSYKNNENYRKNKQQNEENHKQFEILPFRKCDSIVESGCFLETTKREYASKNELNVQENNENKTILQALSEFNQRQPLETEESVKRYAQTMSNNTPSRHNQLAQNNNYEMQNTYSNIKQFKLQKVVPIRLMKSLKLLVDIQHFFRILSRNARIFSRLTENQHYLIGDITSNYSKSLKQKNDGKTYNLLNDFIYIILRLIQVLNKQVFMPSNLLIKAWDTLQSCLIILSTLFLNLELFFEMDISSYRQLFQILFNVSVIDIFIELNTGILQKGNIIYDRNFIFKSYMKNTFFLDLLGNIPLFFYISQVEVQTSIRAINNLLFTFKWVKIYKVFSQITFYVSYEKNYKNIFDLFKLLMLVIGICHVFCLFWHGLVMFEHKNGIENNWLASKGLLNSSIQERYIYSFYFLAVTMATVGYGDITPQNQYEVLFTTITIFVTCVVYAFSLNTIGGIIKNIKKKEKKYKENLQIIHGLMREEEVSRELKIQVSNYIEYLYKESNEIQKKQEKIIIEKLSTKLRNDLTLEIQGKYLNNIPLFKSIQEKDKIAKIMEEQLYSPSETIFTQGDIDDCSLFYIVKGSVSIIFESDQISNRETTQIQLKQKREYFGEISFITGNQRTFTAKAAEFCRIYKINKDKFMSVIKENDHDFENFQMIKENLTLNKNYKFCSIVCSTCKSEKHLSIDCPKTHLTYTNQIIISRYNSKSTQDRNKSERRKVKLNYIKRRRQLEKAIKLINNTESLFEILDFIENESINFNLEDGEINYQQEFDIDDDKHFLQRGNTINQNLLNNLDEYPRKRSDTLQIVLNALGENQEQLLLLLQQQQPQSQVAKFSRKYSLATQKQMIINRKKSIDQIILQQRQQPRKSFLYKASLNLQSVQEQDDQGSNSCTGSLKQQNSFNLKSRSQLTPSMSSSLSSSQSSSSLSSKSSSENRDKKNKKYLHPQKSLQFQDEQNQNLANFTNGNNEQAIIVNSVRDQNHKNQMSRQNSHLKRNSIQVIELNDKLLRSEKQQKNSKEIILNDSITQSSSVFDNKAKTNSSKKHIQFENIVNLIGYNNPQLKEDDITNKRSSILIINGNLGFKQNQQQTDFIKQVSFNKSPNSNGLNADSLEYLKLNTIGNGFKNENKKFQETNESPDQINYLMLSIFDKAKIFKHYFTTYNYPEVVKKWVQFQTKNSKNFISSVNSPMKKKRYQLKRRQSFTQRKQKQIFI